MNGWRVRYAHHQLTMAPVEIQFVANYLTHFLLTPDQQSIVCPVFTEKLHARFVPRHWFPLEPERGSGYRAVSFDPSRQDGYLDPVLCMLAHLLGTSNRELRRNILKNFGVAQASGWTLWTDPGCVSLRIQASGGELKELWGNLPTHLSQPRLGIPSPPTIPSAPRLSPGDSPSKSRAIPILAPAGVTRLAVTPPTPFGQSKSRSRSEGSDQEDDQARHQEMLVENFQAQLKLSSYVPVTEDPYFRPSSRTSCASSSSEGSDRSGFSSSSSSTATSVAPLGMMVKKKMSTNQLPQSSSAAQYPTGYIRHNSSNSMPYVSTNHMPASLTAMSAIQHQPPRRAASPAYASQRRRHVPSASVSSVSGGRGLLVLKEGPGTVTEHSGGKVGVMGGGVLLGLPKDKESGAVVNNSANNRRTNTRRARTTTANP
ncbi:B-cell translocation protein 1, anti-proliferative [Puccinia graminis f. sp. tritici]|uniref:B-cell translocation protein 1, anti-proliferative n=1 Tax=Puccinia graminis f. sp. tritici TaxID=56615 RepID=A0A5B0MSP2_PUCGR|nr:B-cell translocation protein 1, anti-proliferative [Puccinia graminis f. sp. tritici]KAA1079985.1 B-cell translocation protein 1, anti-proliferative [Puccinia graminis f. sp. tritici]